MEINKNDLLKNLITTKHYPLLFSNGTCCNCGKDHVLRCYNKFGFIVDPDIKSISYIKCSNCNASFVPVWIKDDNTTHLIPYAGDTNLKTKVIDSISTIAKDLSKDLVNNLLQK